MHPDTFNTPYNRSFIPLDQYWTCPVGSLTYILRYLMDMFTIGDLFDAFAEKFFIIEFKNNSKNLKEELRKTMG